MKKFDFKIFLVLVFILVTTFFLIFSSEENIVIRHIVYLLGPITAVVAGLIAMKSLGWNGRRATIVASILVGVGLWLLGETATLYFVWKGIDTYPTIADFFFVSGYVFYTLAVVLKIKLFGLHWGKVNTIRWFVLGVSFILITLVVVYMTVLGYDPEGSFLANFTGFSWSLGDLVAGGLSLVLLAMIWEYKDGSVRIGWLWFMGAIFANLVADAVYSLNPGVILEGSWTSIILNSVWIAGYCMFAGYFLEVIREIKKIENKIPNIKE